MNGELYRKLDKINTITCPSCWCIVKYLADKGKVSTREIASDNGMSMHEAVFHLFKLSQAQLVESEMAEGMVKIYQLTPEAKFLIEKLEEIMREMR